MHPHLPLALELWHQFKPVKPLFGHLVSLALGDTSSTIIVVLESQLASLDLAQDSLDRCLHFFLSIFGLPSFFSDFV